MMRGPVGALLAALVVSTHALRYDPTQVNWNLNTNQSATNPINYWGQWENHQYHPSPRNWRFPFYTLFLDRFANGDPSNDDINGTAFEHDLSSTQLRHGGDVAGFVDSLDYLQGMGIKAVYIAGSAFINLPWGSDGYSPTDLTLLDHHFGTIDDWRRMIDEVHGRGMYIVMDNTMATMSDLLGFEGFMNTSTPFQTSEHQVQYKSSRQYLDFHPGNNYNKTCKYPRFYTETGYPVDSSVTNQLVGCYDSEFDQFGDVEAFGVYPDWQRQLAKFASVQDRLREWVPSVREKIQLFSCIMIAMLDIDGFRFDKATQVTVDAQGDYGDYIRRCAAKFGKENFFMPGEITGGNTFGSIYIGRGRLADPAMQPPDAISAIRLNNNSDDKYYIRDHGKNALDAAAFHYTIYRSLTRFLGMDGNLASGYDSPGNWVDAWNDMVMKNDLVNPNPGGPGGFDPRHMYGVTNQDVFRWPAIANGTERMLLGLFITTLHMPGIPLLLWGEEQAFYILDNTAGNYIFGRQAMTSATAWEVHGCYNLKSVQFYGFNPLHAQDGCKDPKNSLDHRNPAHPVRNIIKSMYQMRENFPVLNDGWYLEQLSNQTHLIQYPGSILNDVNTTTETGMWSTLRNRWPGVQGFDQGQGNQSIWLVYQNDNVTVDYQFDCSNNDTHLNITALISPFDEGKTVRNLFYPYEEYTLEASVRRLGIEGSTKANGCLKSLKLEPYGFKALVPTDKWKGPRPMLTKFVPGHDERLQSKSPPGGQETIPIELHFSTEMSCNDLTSKISINSTTEDGTIPQIDKKSVKCTKVSDPELVPLVGAVGTQWTWTADLTSVSNGIHKIIITNVSAEGGGSTTAAVDHLLFRVGQLDNPMVFNEANYTRAILHQDNKGGLFVSHKAAGADLFRYSTNWGSSYSDWLPYTGGNTSITRQVWSGTKSQEWSGEHVILQYWSRMTASSDYIQQGDLDSTMTPRRYPHLYWQGPYNQYGFDAGLDNEIKLDPADGRWKFNFMTEWPTLAQVNIWGMNPDGQPDQTGVLGDIDQDSILDRLPPSSLASVILNITQPPPPPAIAWRFELDDATNRFYLIAVGNMYNQLILYFLMFLIPVLTGALGIWIFMKSFYKVKFNKIGIVDKKGIIPLAIRRRFKRHGDDKFGESSNPLMKLGNKSGMLQSKSALAAGLGGKRRMVMIATMEYDIEDWQIKIKIGGLGVMAQLMGKNLGHQDLIWIVPCVGGIDYPEDQRQEAMSVQILGNPYAVQVQHHVLRNITYVLLDAPVFRQQTKSEPYPPRMDDLDSAIYYSAWNQCIALAIKRFKPDLYHINDYHGAVAPIHLLPDTIPCCLSLHNAEFQGLWPMRTPKERDEVCQVYNLPVDTAAKYVQFGEVFNLLHAGASYLRVHQQGFGAVGVSAKYGKRSYARYPIFWGLKKIGKLPNPDPSDTGEWDKQLPKDEDIKVDPDFEHNRAELKRQAQEWAGLTQDPKADLLVFVGRWSMQKGVDLIADIFPSVLEEHPNVQLVCVGPVIDLYGKFAALKLGKMMEIYPGRVYSKPEFTALPPYIFSGAEFALIPSRDEPFGLVAVEFGRKGALGIGARVGGLGQMPGWWYTVESTTTTHLLHQFKQAIEAALASKQETRAMMRARSAKQRFPVAQWVEDLEILQSAAIKIHEKEASKAHHDIINPNYNGSHQGLSGYNSPSGVASPLASYSRANSNGNLQALGTPMAHNGPVGQLRNASYSNLNRLSTWTRSRPNSSYGSRAASPSREGREDQSSPGQGLSRKLSLGVKAGPGHISADRRGRNRMRKGDDQRRSSRAPRDNVGMAVTETLDEESDNDIIDMYGEEEYTMTEEQAHAMQRKDRQAQAMGTPPLQQLNEDFLAPRNMSFGDRPMRDLIRTPGSPSEPPSLPGTPGAGGMYAGAEDALLPPNAAFAQSGNRLSNSSMLSLDSVVGEKKDFKLQKVDPFFTDSNGEYYKAFEQRLTDLDGKNSESQMCIEDFLVKSEKKWFDRFRDARLGRSHSPAPSTFRNRAPSPEGSIFNENLDANSNGSEGKESSGDQFLLGDHYVPPTGLKKWMQMRIGDWPLYSFFLAFGQIIAANSYQITLLTGTVGQTAEKLYVIASIYLVTSIFWWFCFRWLKSVYSLSLPFIFYGLAFFLIGMAYFVPTVNGRGWTQNLATAMYAVASSSGSIFFALNFGDEGGAPVKAWVYRASVIQGTQQAYVIALWYWGSILTKGQSAGLATDGSIVTASSVANSWIMSAITLPVAVLMWLVGIILFFGLPDYYRQQPGAVPSFYSSITRRKIILWFFVTVLIQNFWLSAPYGRNWGYLWSSNHVEPWQIVLLCVLFFGAVWAIFLWIFGILSKDHSWILPVFAIGLGAPRWCQMLWGCSNIGQWVPWAGGPVASALVGRSLWLWLGVLDALQGVGFGMILLQTLTRIHIAFTLIAAQVLGSIATMIARAVAPNNLGPGDVFPDFSVTLYDGLSKAWFWVALVFQLSICVGFFTFFRKEQLSKP